MALSDKLNAPTPPSPHGLPCSIGALLDQLEGDEKAALEHMLATPAVWNATRLYDAVRDEGYTIGRQSVNRHRRRACRCYKDAA